jgi:hypothetical protein
VVSEKSQIIIQNKAVRILRPPPVRTTIFDQSCEVNFDEQSLQQKDKNVPCKAALIRMPFSGMWRRVKFVCTGVSEERIATIFGVDNPRARDQREQVVAVFILKRN